MNAFKTFELYSLQNGNILSLLVQLLKIISTKIVNLALALNPGVQSAHVCVYVCSMNQKIA